LIQGDKKHREYNYRHLFHAVNLAYGDFNRPATIYSGEACHFERGLHPACPGCGRFEITDDGNNVVVSDSGGCLYRGVHQSNLAGYSHQKK